MDLNTSGNTDLLQTFFSEATFRLSDTMSVPRFTFVPLTMECTVTVHTWPSDDFARWFR